MVGNIYPKEAHITPRKTWLPREGFRRIRQFCLNTITAYGAALTIFLLFRQVIDWYIIDLLNSFAHLLFMLSVVLIVVCLVMRRLRPAVMLLPAAAIFFLNYGALFLPQPGVESGEPHLRLLTFNVYSKRANPADLAGVIQDIDADVVLLQELDPDVGAHFEAFFTDQYPYRVFHTASKISNAGMGVMSRYPILSEEYWVIHRGHQQVTIAFEGEAITLYNSRPIFPFVDGGFSLQEEEISLLLERAAETTGALILAGDFNMSDQSDNYQQITGSYSDVFREVGWGMGFTFPADNPDLDFLPYQVRELMKTPLVRLDYVFHNDNWQSIEAHVWHESGGSDHRPLFVVLALKPNPLMHKEQKASTIRALT